MNEQEKATLTKADIEKIRSLLAEEIAPLERKVSSIEHAVSSIEHDQRNFRSDLARQEKLINEFRFESESRFIEISKNISRLEKKVKDIESDQRTDVSISRAVREMGIFRRDRSSSPLKGNAFLEEIKDDY
jgi:septal ring factor EnvC (AmiA/AmiB activator)